MDRSVDNYSNKARLGHRLVLIDRRNDAWIDVYRVKPRSISYPLFRIAQP
jgi:hypothetical protein